MNELKRQLIEIKELLDLDLLSVEEYERIRQQLLQKMGAGLKSSKSSSALTQKADMPLQVVPDSLFSSSGERWSSETKIEADLPPDDTLVPFAINKDEESETIIQNRESEQEEVQLLNHAVLILHEATTEEKHYPIHDSKLSIGRARGAGLTIKNDPKISRVHCEIQQQGESFYLNDNHSTSGTLLNGRSIQFSVLLADGDQIQIGGSKFLFRILKVPHSKP